MSTLSTMLPLGISILVESPVFELGVTICYRRGSSSAHGAAPLYHRGTAWGSGGRMHVARAELDHVVPAVDTHVHLVGVYARHHVGRSVADVDVPYQGAGSRLKTVSLVSNHWVW